MKMDFAQKGKISNKYKHQYYQSNQKEKKNKIKLNA